MNASKLKQLVIQAPFRPFTVHLSDGAKHRVDYQWQVATSSNSPVFVYFATDDDSDTEHLIAYRSVTEVVVDSVKAET